MRDFVEWLKEFEKKYMTPPESENKSYDAKKPNMKRISRVSILMQRLDKASRLLEQEKENNNLHKSAQANYIIRNIGDELSKVEIFRHHENSI